MDVAVLLSGGVDSSVALYLLSQNPALRLTAFYLKIWLEDDAAALGDCPWEEDLRFATAVCERLSVPLRIVSLQNEYYDAVVQYALAELRAGRTPSPDLFCNERIKFGSFLSAVGAQFDYVASGHYAVLDRDRQPGSTHLVRAVDPVKDQTYFLAHLSHVQLQRLLFPIGNLPKSAVRALAERADLPTKHRPDSQGICFLGKIAYPDFVRHYLGTQPGEIRDQHSGRVLGEHPGFWFFTIGQRTGLRLGNGPWYVVGKDARRNIVFVRHGTAAADVGRREFVVEHCAWIHGDPTVEAVVGQGTASPVPAVRAVPAARTVGTDSPVPAARKLLVKLRHGPQLVAATLHPGDAAGRHPVTLATGDRGIAPGQFAVFYAGDECLGCGAIAGEDAGTPADCSRADDRTRGCGAGDGGARAGGARDE